MILSPGSRIGAYHVLAKLGAGGMGEVYRARDTRLGRDVALKILPEVFASDPDRLIRFETEARTLAALNHPNIAQVHGLEESATTRALVMELVAGEDLSARIARGPIPLDDALPIARQIAEALEAAHEAGIIHRDLKPANIKVRDDGTVKVLDFGLAKALDHTADALGDAATITSPAVTMRGVILGTAAYMAPEQAKGKPVDRRADIWAFGCVLYEMLTGRRAFKGDDVTDTLTAVMRDEPDWSALPADMSSATRQALRLCLQKDTSRRIRDIGSVGLALEGVFDSPAQPLPAAAPRPRARMPGSAWGLAGLLAAAIGGALIVPQLRTGTVPTAPLALRYDIEGPPGVTLLQNAALSSDGRHLVFFASTNNMVTLWLRSLDAVDVKPIEGAPRSVSSVAPPFISPDNRHLAFWDGADRTLKRLPLTGGVPQAIAPVPNYAGGTWMEDGTIVFGARGAGLFRVAATGGTPEPVTTLADGERGHVNPSAAPDGRHVLYHVVSETDRRGVFVTMLDGRERRRLVDDAASGDSGGAHIVPPSTPRAPAYLLYRSRSGSLIARPLDPVTFEPAGEDHVVAREAGFFAVSPAGVLVHLTGNAVQQAETRLVWMTRDGKEGAQVGPAGNYQDLDLAPDGRRAVYAQRYTRLGQHNVWTIDLVRGVPSLLTHGEADERFPTWSADGSAVLLSSGVGRAHSALVRQTLVGGASPEVLLDGRRDVSASDVSADGQVLIYRDMDDSGSQNLLTLPLSASGDRRPTPYLSAAYDEVNGAFMPGRATSPRWVAYSSNESGRPEVYVQSHPVGAGKWQVSSGGGNVPRWRADGRELYYVAADGTLMAVPVTPGEGLEIGAPLPLFTVGTAPLRLYDVGPDGRFLVVRPLEQGSSAPTARIEVLANWQRMLTSPRP